MYLLGSTGGKIANDSFSLTVALLDEANLYGS